MKFEEALYRFKNELLKEYGPDAEIIKLAVSYDLYNRIISDMFSEENNIRVGFVEANEPRFVGIPVVPRRKDDF